MNIMKVSLFGLLTNIQLLLNCEKKSCKTNATEELKYWEKKIKAISDQAFRHEHLSYDPQQW